jgi:uncharacterized membrane protein YphA (DoxX/SURF4 family)
MGVIFVIFGLNGFFHFIPMPPLPQAAGSFMGALGEASYFFPVVKITEIIAGLLLLSGFFVPFAIILLAPVIVQIFLFHAFLAPGGTGMVMPILLVVLEVYLGFFSKEYSSITKQIFRCPKIEA